MANGLLSEITQIIKSRSAGKSRFLVAIAGAPGSGKSTLAEHLAKKLGSCAVVLPMDGFHLDNERLSKRGLLHRKGAPETFDADGFLQKVKSVRSLGVVTFPGFDRNADRTVPNAGIIDESHTITLVEGNYLLLNRSPWSELKNLFDLTVFVDVPRKELEARLVQRWLDHGLASRQAKHRMQENDLRNADDVISNSLDADVIYRSSIGE